MPLKKDCDSDTLTLNRLRKYIVEHKLKPGDHMPPEREIAEELGITRHAVREALKSFEVIGLLSRRPKYGTVLRRVDLRQVAQLTRFAMIRDKEDFFELFTARLMLELSVIPLVIMNIEEKDYAKMEDACRRMEEAIAAGGTERAIKNADEDFHQALILACHNRFVSQYSALINEYFQGNDCGTGDMKPNLLRTVDEHRKIIDCLRHKDCCGVQATLKGHLWYVVPCMALNENALPPEWKPV